MGIQQHPAQAPMAPPPPPSWGELAPEGQPARVVRFCIADGVVSFPLSVFRKWHHTAGEPETLTIHVGKERIKITGTELGVIRAALDLGRLCEVRCNVDRPLPRPGPQVGSIALEAA